MTVLIVDDDSDISFLLIKHFEDAKIEWETARSGEHAVVCCKRRDFSMVVMDYRMPQGMSGIRTAVMLRDEGIHVPIVLHSAYLSVDVTDLAAEFDLAVIPKGHTARLINLAREYEALSAQQQQKGGEG